MSTSSSAAQHLPSAAASPACPAHTFCLSSFGNRTELGEGGSPGSENSRPIQGPSGRVEDRVGKAHPSVCGLLNWSVQLMLGPLSLIAETAASYLLLTGGCGNGQHGRKNESGFL